MNTAERIGWRVAVCDDNAADRLRRVFRLRFRHPKSPPIKSVTVNGKEWKTFDKDKEVIGLVGLTGKAAVVAGY
jgi:hypothetical protein